jgi:hypothetical protein
MARDREHAVLLCELCGKPGADACVRMTAGSDGEQRRAVYGHQVCAGARGVSPLYRLTSPSGEPPVIDTAAIRAETRNPSGRGHTAAGNR